MKSFAHTPVKRNIDFELFPLSSKLFDLKSDGNISIKFRLYNNIKRYEIFICKELVYYTTDLKRAFIEYRIFRKIDFDLNN